MNTTLEIEMPLPKDDSITFINNKMDITGCNCFHYLLMITMGLINAGDAIAMVSMG